MGLYIQYGGGCLLQEVFRFRLIVNFGFHLNEIQYSPSLNMFSVKTRNQSLKTLYHPRIEQKIQNQQPEPKQKPNKFLPTIIQNKDSQKRHAKQLGFSIVKFQNLISAKAAEQNQEDIIRGLFYVIKNFGQIDNNFKSLFINIQIRLRQFLFINDHQICQKFKIREGVSYKKACKHISKFHIQYEQSRKEQFQKLNREFSIRQSSLKQSIQQKDKQVISLKEQVEKYKKMANAQYVRSLERKINNLKQSISTQQQEYKALVKKNQQISEDIQGLRRQLYDQQIKCADQESMIYDLKVKSQKTQLYILNIKDRFEQLSSKMMSIKQIIQKVQNQNELLTSERVKLVNRAAVSFDELTPRPSYKNYFSIQPGTNLLPTMQIMNQMIQDLVPNKQEYFNKYFVAKKNRKLLQGEAIRENVTKEINRAQRQLQSIIITRQ